MFKVIQHHTVVRDGWHNHNTEIAFWKDYYWLAYRRSSGHYNIDGSIIVLRSIDLKRWQQIASISVGDDRDPKFFSFNNKLFLFFGTFFPPYYLGRSPSIKLGRSFATHMCTTSDGIHWSDPQQVAINQWIFRVREQSGKLYGIAYSWQGDPHERNHGPVDLLESNNGASWQKISQIIDIGHNANEGDLFFHQNGDIWAIVASWKEPRNRAFFCSSRPPFKRWKRIKLDVSIHSPTFCYTKEKLYVIGFRGIQEPWIPQPTPPGNQAIFIVEKNQVKPFYALPSYGDGSYPSMISREPGKLLISYNSQHAYLAGVLPSKTPIPISGARPGIYTGDEDIFIMEIAVE